MSTSKRARVALDVRGRGRRRARRGRSAAARSRRRSTCGSGGAGRPACRSRPRGPARMIVTRSHSASTSARMWLDSSTVVPAARRSSTHARNTSSMSGSSPDVGSSRISSSTSAASAATSATFCRLPFEYVRPFLVGSSSKRSSSAARRRGIEAAAQPAEQVDRLAAGEVGPEVHVAGDVREPPVQRDRVAPRVAAEQARRARVGAQQAEQHADRRRLARAVRPEEAVDLAAARPSRSSPSRARVGPNVLTRPEISIAGAMRASVH